MESIRLFEYKYPNYLEIFIELNVYSYTRPNDITVNIHLTL